MNLVLDQLLQAPHQPAEAHPQARQDHPHLTQTLHQNQTRLLLRFKLFTSQKK